MAHLHQAHILRDLLCTTKEITSAAVMMSARPIELGNEC